MKMYHNKLNLQIIIVKLNDFVGQNWGVVGQVKVSHHWRLCSTGLAFLPEPEAVQGPKQCPMIGGALQMFGDDLF